MAMIWLPVIQLYFPLCYWIVLSHVYTGKRPSVCLYGSAFGRSESGCTCCLMHPRGGGTVSMDWLSCVCVWVRVWVSVCRSVCVWGYREWESQKSHRSISFLLWRSGDLRCMASCDPDSLLLSPPATSHWHSGMTSEERGGDERNRGRKARDGALNRSW